MNWRKFGIKTYAWPMMVCLMCLGDANTASSDDLCGGLRRALRSAGNKFVDLRGKFDFDLDEYRATVTFGSATDCVTSTGKGVTDLSCSQSFYNFEESTSAFKYYSRGIENCFGAEIKDLRSKLSNWARYKYEETGDQITLRLNSITNRSRNRPDVFKITIEVTYVDPRF